MGNELLNLLFWIMVWLIASVASFFFKTQPWTGARYALWAVRLSFPMLIVSMIGYFVCIEPILLRFSSERERVGWNKAEQAFGSLCEKHVPQATKILKVVENEFPKRIFIDRIEFGFGQLFAVTLADCVTRRSTPACSRLKLESIEGVRFASEDFGPCKSGRVVGSTTPGMDDSCRPKYWGYAIGESKVRPVDIDQPTSDYIIRVGPTVETGVGYGTIRKYQITFETKETRQVLAKTEILNMRASCPEPEEAIARMLLQVFPQQ